MADAFHGGKRRARRCENRHDPVVVAWEFRHAAQEDLAATAKGGLEAAGLW
jgi:hypothetical protein